MAWPCLDMPVDHHSPEFTCKALAKWFQPAPPVLCIHDFALAHYVSELHGTTHYSLGRRMPRCVLLIPKGHSHHIFALYLDITIHLFSSSSDVVCEASPNSPKMVCLALLHPNHRLFLSTFSTFHSHLHCRIHCISL